MANRLSQTPLRGTWGPVTIEKILIDQALCQAKIRSKPGNTYTFTVILNSGAGYFNTPQRTGAAWK